MSNLIECTMRIVMHLTGMGCIQVMVTCFLFGPEKWLRSEASPRVLEWVTPPSRKSYISNKIDK